MLSIIMNKTDTSSPRILVISPNWIGDAVMAQPLLQRLRALHPQWPIDVLAPAWVAPVWRAMREVDTVMETPFKHGKLQLGERRRFAAMLRPRGYAEAYVLPNTMKFALIPWLAGIPKRVGYKGEMRYGLLNVVHHDERSAPRRMAAFYAALADAPIAHLPQDVPLPQPSLAVADDASAAVMQRIGVPAGVPLVVFAPGAEFGSAKRWPSDRYAELANTLRQSHPHAEILLLGSGKDKPVCDDIVAAAPGVRNLAGATSLSEAIALIARASAVVCNDSGLMHIAAALQRPLVAVFGPTDPRHTPPLSELATILWLHIECAPCQQRECPLGHHRCMKDISTEMVWKPLKPMLNGERSTVTPA
jgi:heptosyltransferase-2